MSAEGRAAVDQDSKAAGVVWAIRALAVAGGAGGLLLVVATALTIIRLDVHDPTGAPAPVDTTLSGWDRHGPVLILLGLIALWMLFFALRGMRGAMTLLAATGVVSLLVVILGDAVHIHDTGTIGRLYEDAAAGAGTGFYAETLGAVLTLIAGGGLLLLDSAPARPARAAGASERPGPEAPPRDEPPPRREPLDWFS